MRVVRRVEEAKLKRRELVECEKNVVKKKRDWITQQHTQHNRKHGKNRQKFIHKKYYYIFFSVLCSSVIYFALPIFSIPSWLPLRKCRL